MWCRVSDDGSICEEEEHVDRRDADDMVRARTLDDEPDMGGVVDETPVVELRRVRVLREGDADEVCESEEVGRPAATELEEERERRPNSSMTELLLGRESLCWRSALGS